MIFNNFPKGEINWLFLTKNCICRLAYPVIIQNKCYPLFLHLLTLTLNPERNYCGQKNKCFCPMILNWLNYCMYLLFKVLQANTLLLNFMFSLWVSSFLWLFKALSPIPRHQWSSYRPDNVLF